MNTKIILTAIAIPLLWWVSAANADNAGERCTVSAATCFDKVSQQQRTCTTTTCTYNDGHSTTSVTVEEKGPTPTNPGKPIGGVAAPGVAAPVGATDRK
jgi:hypothetical protein